MLPISIHDIGKSWDFGVSRKVIVGSNGLFNKFRIVEFFWKRK